MTKNYGLHRGKGGRFVQMHHWLLDSEAWRCLRPGPRALYLELRRRFTGGNNGQIFLSHRDAAEALCVGRDTVANYFSELIDKGFIAVTRGHCLGPSGIGQATVYRLTEERYQGKPPSKEFMAWKKQNPGRKIQHSLVEKSDAPRRKSRFSASQMSENPAAPARSEEHNMSENPATYTFSHITSTGRSHDPK